MSGANSFKFVLLPPQSETTRDWAKRLAEIVPEARVIVAEDADTAAREIVDAEAAFGWLGSDLLSKATKLRWLQAPQAAPPAGYYYPELIAAFRGGDEFPRDIQRPHRRPHPGFCAGLRTRAAYLHSAAIPARVEEKPIRKRRRGAPAGSDGADCGCRRASVPRRRVSCRHSALPCWGPTHAGRRRPMALRNCTGLRLWTNCCLAQIS